MAAESHSRVLLWSPGGDTYRRVSRFVRSPDRRSIPGGPAFWPLQLDTRFGVCDDARPGGNSRPAGELWTRHIWGVHVVDVRAARNSIPMEQKLSIWSVIRRHLSYANIAATLALVFSMSAGAVAATHYMINSPRQINPKVLKKLKGKTGATGVT